MASLTLTELIDPAILQEIQDGFAHVTGMAALTTDESGSPVTEGSNFTDFCMKYTRKSAAGCKACEECDRHGGEVTQKTGKAAAYVCHAGLMDFAAPIELNGQFIGSFIGGQVLIEQPDEQTFRQIARGYGINEDEYVEAVKKVNVVERKRIEAAADFLQTIAKILSSMAYTSYNETRTNESLRSSMEYTAGIIREVRRVADENVRSVRQMEEKFKQLSSLATECKDEVENCTDIVNGIQDNATTTHILGLNASIEASRAKEGGKGFAVIAQEVRGLADTSRTSADTIKRKIEGIGERTREMTESTIEAKVLVDQCLKDIEQLKDIIVKLQNNR
ncbi:MAG: PocR ligand-binding domain-containing protein [Bacteroidales bacterium]|nr:PocR ligand-binding domain-containing protein [Bacteroidales bacterium]